MPAPAGLRFRAAGPGDANAIAGLHADSWQRHYRGAFSASTPSGARSSTTFTSHTG
jgi:hypothetical protein